MKISAKYLGGIILVAGAGFLLFQSETERGTAHEQTVPPAAITRSPAQGEAPPRFFQRTEAGARNGRAAGGEPEWLVPFGKEFWRVETGAAMSMEEAAAKFAPGGPAVSEAIERVSHAFRTNASGAVQVSAANYRVGLTPRGFVFEPGRIGATENHGEAPGGAALFSVRAGTPSTRSLEWNIRGNTAQARLPGRLELVQHLETRASGAFLTWIVPRAPAAGAELRILLHVNGMEHAGKTASGHHFAVGDGIATMRFGNVTAVDSAGGKWPVETISTEEGLLIEVPETVLAQAVYPLAIDPEISAEQGIDAPYPPDTALVSNATAVSNGSTFLVVWEQSRGSIRAARVGMDGSVLDPGGIEVAWPRQFTDFAMKPAAASNGKDYLVAWLYEDQAERRLEGVHISAAGKILGRGNIARISTYRIASLPDPSVASDGEDYLVAWMDAGKFYAAKADPGGSEWSAGQTSFGSSGRRTVLSSPVALWNGSAYAVAWRKSELVYDMDSGGWQRLVHVSLQHLTSAGELLDESPIPAVREETVDAEPGALAFSFDGTQYFFAWGSRAARTTIAGELLSPGIIESGASEPAAVWDGEDFWTIWRDGAAIVGRRLSPGGEWRDAEPVTLARNEEIATPPHPAVAAAAAGGRLLVAYADQQAHARVLAKPFAFGEAGAGRVLSARTFFNVLPAPECTPLGDGFLVVWSAPQPGAADVDIFGARLDRTGALLDPNGIVLAAAEGDQIQAAAASIGDEALVVWEDQRFRAELGSEVYGKVVRWDQPGAGGSGVLLAGGESGQVQQTLAANGENYLLSWLQFGPEAGLYAAPVSREGIISGPATHVMPSGRFNAALASDGENFLLVWNTPSADMQSEGGIGAPLSHVEGIRLAADGALLDDRPFQISTNWREDTLPTAAFNGANYLVAWQQRISGEFHDHDIHAAAVSADGIVRPSVIIAESGRNEASPALTANDGGFFISWQETSEETGLTHIYGAYLDGGGELSNEGRLLVNGAGHTHSPEVAMHPRAGTLVVAEGARPESHQVVWNLAPAYEPPLVEVDPFTGGAWKGRFGADGRLIARAGTATPPDAEVVFSNARLWTWDDSTTDPSALERPDGSGRIAACWYSPDWFEVALAFSGEGPRQVAFYLLDWDTNERVQKVEVFDAATGERLHSHTAANFHEGKYLVHEFDRDVRVRFTRVAGYNAVLSGIFFQPAGAPPEETAPPGSSAAFIGMDESTQGDWQERYGGEGFLLVAGEAFLPNGAEIEAEGESEHVWAWGVEDAPALEKASGSGRIAACWHAASSFNVEIDASPGDHLLSIYLLDWDLAGRVQEIELIDSETGVPLDSRTIEDFGGGIYMTWEIEGAVTLRLTAIAGPNAVLSGIFFD